MKLDVSDIKRINLEENDILLLRVPGDTDPRNITAWKELIEDEYGLKGRVMIISGNIEVGAISKK